jgi:hypothetical protein
MVVVCFKVLSKHLRGGTEKTHDKLSQDSLSPGQDSKTGPPQHDAGIRAWGGERRFMHIQTHNGNVSIPVLRSTEAKM